MKNWNWKQWAVYAGAMVTMVPISMIVGGIADNIIKKLY